MQRLTLAALLLVSLHLAACGSSSAAGPCDGVTGTCLIFSAGAKESDIANAFATAKDGTTFAFGAGSFAFTNTLTVQNKNITIKGAGQEATTLDFSGLAAATSGIGVDALDGSDGFTVVDLGVKDTFKNGIKAKSSVGVTFRRVKIFWTATDAKTHGDYALYPVFCQKVLVESCDISGASDAGIYVGQSQTIIVRNNSAHDNVAGIEIENSYDADVYGNTAKNNTGGILVFDLPGAGNQHDGHHVRVYQNTITANNTQNFNNGKSTVSEVPAGTGTFVLTTRDVEIFQNTYSSNKTAAVSLVSYFVAGQGQPSGDPLYDPGISKHVWVHDNTFTTNGTGPDSNSDLGILLGIKLSSYPGAHVPELIIDGVGGPPVSDKPNANNPNAFCFSDNGSVSFMNLHFDQYLGNVGSGGSAGDVSMFDFSATAGSDYNCKLTAQPVVAPWF